MNKHSSVVGMMESAVARLGYLSAGLASQADNPTETRLFQNAGRHASTRFKKPRAGTPD